MHLSSKSQFDAKLRFWGEKGRIDSLTLFSFLTFSKEIFLMFVDPTRCVDGPGHKRSGNTSCSSNVWPSDVSFWLLWKMISLLFCSHALDLTVLLHGHLLQSKMESTIESHWTECERSNRVSLHFVEGIRCNLLQIVSRCCESRITVQQININRSMTVYLLKTICSMINWWCQLIIHSFLIRLWVNTWMFSWFDYLIGHSFPLLSPSLARSLCLSLSL